MVSHEQEAQVSVSSELAKLFETIETRFHSTSLDTSRWYVLALACLVAGPDPETAAQLYLHLIAKQEYSASKPRQELMRRLREVLVKAVSIVGVCKPIEAVLAIAGVEREEDRDYTSTRNGWQCDKANYDRGMGWFRKVYTRNSNDQMGIFDAHKDFAWISSEITYGLYLSDRQVLDDVDTEMVVLPAIMMQNLKHETHWHIRGARRIGVPKEDVEIIWDTIRLIASHFGINLDKVPTVDAVEPDV